MSELFDGQCFCGSVRFRMKGRPMFIHCCHCRDCQRQVGSAFAVNGLIEGDRLELIAGAPEATEMQTDSGYPHDVYRCPDCQSALWSDYGRRPWLRFVRMTTLDRAADFTPDVHIYTRSKLPWVVLPADARAFGDYYDMASEWPEDSLRRRKAAQAAAQNETTN